MSRHKLRRVTVFVAGLLGALAMYTSTAFAVGPPVVTVGTASGIHLTSANLNGTVDKNGAETTYKFEYGTTKSYGKSTPVKTLGASGVVPVSALIVAQEPSTTYHYRVSATNSQGTTVSSDSEYKLLSWKVDGKKISELGFTPKFIENNPAGATLATIEFNYTPTTAVAIKCTEGPGGYFTSGVLGSHYDMWLGKGIFAWQEETCKTYKNGASWSVCDPTKLSANMNLDSLLRPPSTTFNISFNGETCLMPETYKVDQLNGFVIDGPAKEEGPSFVPITLTGPAVMGGAAANPVTITLNEVWWLEGPHRFAIN